MKLIKLCVALIAFTAFTGAYAQKENKQQVDKTKIYNFSIKNSNETVDYTVAVNTEMANYVTMKNLSKEEQTRKDIPLNAKTTIKVDNDWDNSYDNTVVLTYETKSMTPAKIEPTNNGFDISINGENVSYNFLKQECTYREGCPIQIKNWEASK